VAAVLGQTFHDDKVLLRTDLMAYLAEKGIVRDEGQQGLRGGE